jgi:hypothetical protein
MRHLHPVTTVAGVLPVTQSADFRSSDGSEAVVAHPWFLGMRRWFEVEIRRVTRAALV